MHDKSWCVTCERNTKVQSGETNTTILSRAWRLAVLRASNHTRVIPEIASSLQGYTKFSEKSFLNSLQEKIENKYRRDKQHREFELKHSLVHSSHPHLHRDGLIQHQKIPQFCILMRKTNVLCTLRTPCILWQYYLHALTRARATEYFTRYTLCCKQHSCRNDNAKENNFCHPTTIWLFHPVELCNVAEINSKRIRGHTRCVKKKKKKKRNKSLNFIFAIIVVKQMLQNYVVAVFQIVGKELGRVLHAARTRRFRACWARSVVHLHLHDRKKNLFDEIVIFFASSTSFSHPVEWT